MSKTNKLIEAVAERAVDRRAPLRDAAEEKMCSFCWKPIEPGKAVAGSNRVSVYHDGCHILASEIVA